MNKLLKVVLKLNEFLAKLPIWFENSSISRRSLILTIATIFLIFKFYRFYMTDIALKISAITMTMSSTVNKYAVYNLIHFNTLLLVAISLIIIAGFALLTGRPHRPGIIFGKLKEHPFWTFAIFTFLFTALLLGTPTLISNLMFTYYGEDGLFFKSTTLHPAYVREAVILALCFSISFADITVRSGVNRWWSYLFFLVPIFNICPLLWWNGLAGLLPSRWWSAVKPIFIAASCLSMGLSLPVAQPIRQGFPVHSVSSQQTLKDNIGYYVHRIPGKPEVFMRSGEALTNLLRSSDGKWTVTNKQNTDFKWDHASLDPKRHKVYIFDGTTRTLHIYDYPTLKELDTYALPLGAFPIRSFDLLHAFDVENGILVLADKEGFIVTINVETFEVLNSAFLTGESEIWNVQYDPVNEELIVLQNHNLIALSIFDMKYIRSKSFESAAYDFLLDNSAQRLLISFPKEMSVLVLDKNSFSEIAKIEAPATVRKMAIDYQRRLLFLTSISGFVEIRNADDYQFLRRERIGLWIHWLEVIPEFGEIIITMGDIDSIVWSYISPGEGPNIFDEILHNAENFLRSFSHHLSLGKSRAQFIGPMNNPLMRQGARIVFVAPLNEIHKLNMQAEKTNDAGFQMTLIKDPTLYKQYISQNTDEIELVIFDVPTFGDTSIAQDPKIQAENIKFSESALKLIRWTENNHPRIEVLHRFRGL